MLALCYRDSTKEQTNLFSFFLFPGVSASIATIAPPALESNSFFLAARILWPWILVLLCWCFRRSLLWNRNIAEVRVGWIGCENCAAPHGTDKMLAKSYIASFLTVAYPRKRRASYLSLCLKFLGSSGELTSDIHKFTYVVFELPFSDNDFSLLPRGWTLPEKRDTWFLI